MMISQCYKVACGLTTAGRRRGRVDVLSAKCYRAFSVARVTPGESPLNEERPKTAAFGFREVPEEQKQALVADVFHGVAQNYDLMNDLMSGTLHRLWKDEFVRMLNPIPHDPETGRKPLKILDVAGGTGDIAFRIVRAMRKAGWKAHCASNEEGSIENADVIVCDINESMLAVGQDRAKAQRIGIPGDGPAISWLHGNAEELPIESNSIDAYTIAFGIRNVTHIDRALSEAHRVLRRGGRFICLEFSHVENPVLRTIYDNYSFTAIPKIGKLVANDESAYQYLVESIRKFPTQKKFKRMIEDAGFKLATYENFTGGVVAVHSGFKL